MDKVTVLNHAITISPPTRFNSHYWHVQCTCDKSWLCKCENRNLASEAVYEHLLKALNPPPIGEKSLDQLVEERRIRNKEMDDAIKNSDIKE